MNNYYTLIYLKRELKEKIISGFFEFAISPHKDVLEIYIKKEGERCRLIFSANPTETVLFLDTYRPPKKSNVIDFFEPLEGKKITEVELAEKDRLMYVHFEHGSYLQFKLFSNSPNAMLANEGEIKDAFKHPDEVRGQDPLEPYAPKVADDISPDAKAKNQITRLNPLLPRNLLPALIEQHSVDEMGIEEVRKFTRRITTALLEDPHPRVLITGDVCLWSEEILGLPADENFDKVNGAVRHAYRNAVHLRRLNENRQGVKQLLERVLAKKEAQLEQLQQADKSLERADEYEKYGHLLMAHADKSIEYGRESIEVDNFYDNNRPVEIPLKEGYSIAENAEHYYDKAKSSRRNYEEARKRIPRVEDEVNLAGALLEELKDIGRLPELEKWIKEHSDDLEQFGYGVEEEQQATSPFRKFKVGKYEVWIGKNAKSNDRLTSHAHKEDVWLHARGVGGSHVVIRMGNTRDYPPKEVILRAASYAAYYSKARGMKTAPVMYTKRKYVRKPKGADPGAVVVEREKVEMVPPMKPKNR